MIRIDKLPESLQTQCFGRSVFFTRKVDSTNEWAKKLVRLGACEGTVVLAEMQECGYGRLGRKWVSPRGGLWFSIILKPKLKPAEAAKLVFVAGLAVAEVLHELYCLEVETKWPNDVMVSGRKICGMLSEMSTAKERIDHVIVGIGINANFNVQKHLPRELWKNATSLETELGKKISLEKLFRALLQKTEDIYETFMEKGFAPVLEKWKRYAMFLGCQVKVAAGTEIWNGLAIDVDGDGLLVLKLKGGRILRVLAGDVTFRKTG